MCVMSTKAIAEGEELTFDYQWERRPGRPLTKCYCGAEKCRGFLEAEVYVEDPETGKVMGNWRKPKPEEKGEEVRHFLSFLSLDKQACSSFFINKRTLHHPPPSPQLVGKKVKIYFEGNYSYLEAEVFSYDPTTGKHDVKFVCDGEDSKEMLDPSNPSSSDFFVFDLSLAPTEIKKRKEVGNANAKVQVFDGDRGDLDMNGNVIVRNGSSPKPNRETLNQLKKRSKVRKG